MNPYNVKMYAPDFGQFQMFQMVGVVFLGNTGIYGHMAGKLKKKVECGQIILLCGQLKSGPVIG